MTDQVYILNTITHEPIIVSWHTYVKVSNIVRDLYKIEIEKRTYTMSDTMGLYYIYPTKKVSKAIMANIELIAYSIKTAMVS